MPTILCPIHTFALNSLWLNDTVYGDTDLGQHWRRYCNGSLPAGTKPLPWPMLTYHQQGPVIFIWWQIHKRYNSHQSVKLAGKNDLEFHLHLSAANELWQSIKENLLFRLHECMITKHDLHHDPVRTWSTCAWYCVQYNYDKGKTWTRHRTPEDTP